MNCLRDIGLALGTLLSLVATAPSVLAQGSAVQIQDISPRGWVPGEVTRVIVTGASLESARTLWTSLPVTVVRVKGPGDGPGQATFDVTVPRTSVGRGAVRVMADAGLSNVRLVLLDGLPGLAESRVGDDRVLPGPTAVDGMIDPASTDQYSIRLNKAQRLTVDVWARRLGSSLDPVIRLADSAGRSLVTVDDSPGLAGDAAISLVAPATGLYTVVVTDVSRRGGKEFFYRLRIGHFEPVAMAFPFRVKTGRNNKLQLLGPRVAETLTLASSTPVGTTWVGGPAGPGGGRSLLPVQVVGDDVLVEREPNGRREQAQELPTGGRVSGRFEKPGDQDWYRVSLKKGRKIQVVGNTASIGVAGRLYMRLVDAEGRTMVEVPPSVSTRTTVEHTTGSDRDAWLVVEELQRRGGASFGYQLECRFVERGFSLSAASERLHAKPGGKVAVKVTASRREFKGAIKLGVEGLGPDVELAGQSIPSGKNETTMTITLPAGRKPGELIGLKIVGRGLLEPPDAGETVIERSSVNYNRGDLGKYEGFISDKKGGLNYAEYDVELPEAGEYLVLLKYAAMAVRVASMKLNGQTVNSGIMSKTTGSWDVKTARWFNEGLVKFPQGKSVLRLEKTGVFSHLTTIRIARQAPRSKTPPRSVQASASTLDALRGGLGGMTFVPRELDGTLFLSVGQK